MDFNILKVSQVVANNWYDDLLYEIHLVRFGKAVAPVSSSLQNAFYRMTDFSFCKKKVSSHSKAPEFTNLPLLAKLEISKVRRNGCFQKDWTCARVQAPLVVLLHQYLSSKKGNVSKYVFVQLSSC